MPSNRDLDFIGRRYETYQLPKEKKYLQKYFKTPLQKAFVKYFFVFGDFDNFCNHTGIVCQTRSLRELRDRLLILETAHKNFKMAMDLDSLARLESGKFKISLEKGKINSETE